MTVQILKGNCLEVLPRLPAGSVDCVVTSPPYWGLRDYGVAPSIWDGNDACIGREHTWGEVGKSSQRQRNGAEGGIHAGRATDKLADNITLHPETGSFCLRCKAWRGAHGLEPTFDLFVKHEVLIFEEVRRVLKNDGTLWLNLGDSYSGSGKGGNPEAGKQATNKGSQTIGTLYGKTGESARQAAVTNVSRRMTAELGFPAKNLIGIPWRVAFALQAAGWWLRSDIIWHKLNPMPESVLDRPTRSHEHLFLLTKNERYFYDSAAIKEPLDRPDEGERQTPARFGGAQKHVEAGKQSRLHSGNEYLGTEDGKRNKRDVWSIAAEPFPDAHFATFPPALIEPCILAGCPKGGTVLDPFGGAGTTGMVADRLGRNAILIELNPDYADLAERRIKSDAGMFAEVSR